MPPTPVLPPGPPGAPGGGGPSGPPGPPGPAGPDDCEDWSAGQLIMRDSGADGWNGAELKFTYCDGVVFSTHTMSADDAEIKETRVCLPSEFRIIVSAGNSPGQVSW